MRKCYDIIFMNIIYFKSDFVLNTAHLQITITRGFARLAISYLLFLSLKMMNLVSIFHAFFLTAELIN